jgi:hypothetical protein
MQKRHRKRLLLDLEPRHSSKLQKKGKGAPITTMKMIRVNLERCLGVMHDREVLE